MSEQEEARRRIRLNNAWTGVLNGLLLMIFTPVFGIIMSRRGDFTPGMAAVIVGGWLFSFGMFLYGIRTLRKDRKAKANNSVRAGRSRLVVYSVLIALGVIFVAAWLECVRRGVADPLAPLQWLVIVGSPLAGVWLVWKTRASVRRGWTLSKRGYVSRDEHPIAFWSMIWFERIMGSLLALLGVVILSRLVVEIISS